MTDSLLAQIALTLVPQVGAVTAKTLVSYAGSAAGVFQLSKKELLRIPGVGPALAEGLRLAEPWRVAEREIVFLEKNDVNAVFYTDARYPVRLRQNVDCPAMLYFKGSGVELLQSERLLAIVGTRQPTEYGRALCDKLVEDLKPYGVVLVSGLAFGIDVAAHRQATASGIANIGVLGHGLGGLYPREHREVARVMVQHGGLLTEYTHLTKPDRENFPMRNRIIAGLCDALAVVETGLSGGSIISAELACQYGREVFAFPGRTTDARSAGCNALIKQEKARLAESAADVADVMGWMPKGQERNIQIRLFHDLSPAETQLMTAIRNRPEIPIDLLAEQVALPPGELAARLLDLEFKGLVRTLPGKRYVAVG